MRITLILIGLIFSYCGQKENNDKHIVETRVFDHAYLLSKDQVDSLDYLIQKLESDVGSQIAIWTQISLDGRNIDELSLETAKRMNLGRTPQNDGILIFISVADRKARIEVGTGLENILKDEIASQLLIEDLIPNFKLERYGLGLYLVTDKISKLINDNLELVGTKPQYVNRFDSIKSEITN